MVCLAPAMAFADQTYTNADLAKFQVPGAYTNQDLKRLPPMPVQKRPAATLPAYEPAPVPTASLQAWHDSLKSERDALAAELCYEKSQVDFSESAFAGDTRSYDVRLGYRTQATPLIRELEKRVTLLDRQIDLALDAARKAGAVIDRR
jgi:hypothetical protein